MTIDLTGSLGAERLRHASVRGTIAEGTRMIARVNDFEKLYYDPSGHTVCFTYRDRPGVLGQIGAALAAAGINIDDVRNPHDRSGRHSLALLRVSQPVPAEVIERVRKQISADHAFYASF